LEITELTQNTNYLNVSNKKATST